MTFTFITVNLFKIIHTEFKCIEYQWKPPSKKHVFILLLNGISKRLNYHLFLFDL